MTPQTKARKLIEKFISDGLHQKHMGRTSARQCALILVDEILDEDVYELFDKRIEYWLEVKQEIEKQ